MKRTSTKACRKRWLQHAILKAGSHLDAIRTQHVIGAFLISHGLAMAARRYGTVNLIEQVTGISHIWVGMVIAAGGVLYFCSQPQSRRSLIGLLPHALYALFALFWALTTANAPMSPPLAYFAILLMALGKFFNYHFGNILFLLSAQWELNRKPDADV